MEKETENAADTAIMHKPKRAALTPILTKRSKRSPKTYRNAPVLAVAVVNVFIPVGTTEVSRLPQLLGIATHSDEK